MSKAHMSHHGSKQFWPRRRAKHIVPRVRSWISTEQPKVLGFAGYKAGMSHIMFKDARANSPTKREVVKFPVTVIECPPLKVFSITLYRRDSYGLHTHTHILSKKIDKVLARTLNLPKKELTEKQVPQDLDEVHIRVHTQPEKTGIGKKRPEIFEVSVGKGQKALDFAHILLDKEIKVSELFKAGDMIDVHAVNKGKGFQGAVKRFGVALREHKSEKKRRAVVLGPQSPRRILWGQLLPGQMGYHLRTDYNKEVLAIGTDFQKVNPKGGFLRYGTVKNEYVLLKGSVPGPKKRLIKLLPAVRHTKAKQALKIDVISSRSQQ